MRFALAILALTALLVPACSGIEEDPNDPQLGTQDGALCKKGTKTCSDGTKTTCCGKKQTCCVGMPFQVPTCINGNICPISRRSYKTDIAYLDDGKRESVKDELMRYKLATYRYKADKTKATHLGFIIDDVAPSAAVEGGDGDHVDLYGYTSMAVAALQQQQREIDALKAEVKALEAALKKR